MPPIRETHCRWCGGELAHLHPKGPGRPRLYCSDDCANEYRSFERQRERDLERHGSLALAQRDVFEHLPLGASRGRPPRLASPEMEVRHG